MSNSDAGLWQVQEMPSFQRMKRKWFKKRRTEHPAPNVVLQEIEHSLAINPRNANTWAMHYVTQLQRWVCKPYSTQADRIKYDLDKKKRIVYLEDIGDFYKH